MGLTKQYLRYTPGAVFGLVASPRANAVFVALRGERARYVAVAMCELVAVWDLRKGEKVLVIPGDKSEVTRLAAAPCRGGAGEGYTAGVELAAGHVDGAVRLLSLLTGEKRVTFTGHRTAVTALVYHPDGTRLVSGSQDTDVIVWDVVGECGLYRLKGHKDAVTSARFFSTKHVLLTGSKDSFVKFWDLDTQHCFKTLVGHRSEVWSLTTFGEDSRLVTGSADSELRVWELSCPDGSTGPKRPRAAAAAQDGDPSDDENAEEDEEERIVSAHKLGSLLREGRDRVVSMVTDPSGRYLICHGLDQTLEVFRIQTEEEVKKVLDKRRKKQRKRAARKAEAGLEAQQQQEEVTVERTVQDEIVRVANIRASAKIRSVDARVESGGRELRVVLVLANNLVETHVVVVAAAAAAETRRVGRVAAPGHRSDVRTLAFSSDNTAVLSASGESAKIWNRASLQCIRSMDCQYALSSIFVPGDRQVVLGSKTGKLQLFDLASGTQMECVDAHDSAIWSLCMAPDQRGFVSGGADKLVKFWEFELVKSGDAGQTSGGTGLTLTPSRALALDEEVLCVRFTPDHRLLCVSLLDCTVKAFYTDSLKFFLNLYGHKLPVLCMDISYDSRLIATGSSDRNVKIWGLDFGDCHRSLFAHDDSVMCLQFVPKTHLFFTAGKDGKIKQWDADRFELVQTLEGHHGAAWSVAVSPSGDHLLSCGHDKSLRLWERTREPLVLEDEREMEREAEFEESVAKGAEPIVPGETEGEAGMAARKTMETVKAAERIMEALELYRVESQKLEEHKQACKAANKELPPPALDPVLVASGNLTPEKYMLEVIKKVKSSELEEALLVLPFSYIPELLSLFLLFLRQGRAVELVCRALFFILRIHHGQITSNGMLLEVISELRESSLLRVREMRDVVGFNVAALQLLHREIEAKQEVALFVDATQKTKDKKRKRKVREKQRAVLALAL